MFINITIHKIFISLSKKRKRKSRYGTEMKCDEYHGYGLISVRKTAEKYNGDLVIRHGEGVFRASAILYPK